MVPVHFIFGSCLPRNPSPCSLAPLTVLAHPIRASRRPPWPLTLVLLEALDRRLVRNSSAPPHNDQRHTWRLPSGSMAWPGRAAEARCTEGRMRVRRGCFHADSASTALRLCVEMVAMCPWPVVACPCDSEGPTWCNLLVSARATRRYIVHGVNIVLANVWFLVRQLY